MSDLIALTDDGGTGDLNTEILNQVIQNASDVIDAGIGNIYDVPIGVPSAPIPAWALIITCFFLYRRRLVPDEKNNFSEQYNTVVKLLEMVNDGKYRLAIPLVRDFPQVAANLKPSIYGGGTNFVTNSM